MNLPLLTALAEAAGPSGREERVRDVVSAELEPLCDRVEVDPLGNLIGTREGAGRRLMLAAHMDEIGLMATHVEDRGFIRVIPLGGWDARTLVGQRVMVHGREDVEGVVGLTPVHLLDQKDRAKALEVTDLAIDVGLPAERVRELVRPGDVATRIRALRPLGELVTGKALDDRVGVFVMIEALRAAGRLARRGRGGRDGPGGGRPARSPRGHRPGAPRHRPRDRHLPGQRRARRARLGAVHPARSGHRDPRHGRQRDRRPGARRPARRASPSTWRSPTSSTSPTAAAPTPGASSCRARGRSPAASRSPPATCTRASRPATRTTSTASIRLVAALIERIDEL